MDSLVRLNLQKIRKTSNIILAPASAHTPCQALQRVVQDVTGDYAEAEA